MGSWDNHYIIAEGYDKELKKYYSKLTPKKKRVFHFHSCVTNGVVVLIMFPSNSKVGWDTHKYYKKVEEEFRDFLIKNEMRLILKFEEAMKILSTLNLEEIRGRLEYNWYIWEVKTDYLNDSEEVFSLESKEEGGKK